MDDDGAVIVKIRDFSDDIPEHNALASVLDAIRSRQNMGNSGNACNTQNQTPKQALMNTIKSALEKFEADTGLVVENLKMIQNPLNRKDRGFVVRTR